MVRGGSHKQLSSLVVLSNATRGIAAPSRWLIERLLQRVEIDPQWHQTVADAHRAGAVVHMMRSRSLLDRLCLESVCRRCDLPIPGFVNAPGVAPLTDRWTRSRGAIDIQSALPNTLNAGLSALLFLRDGTTNSESNPPSSQDDPLAALVRYQRAQARPILLVPQTLVWSKLPSHKHKTLVDLARDAAERTSDVRALAQLLLTPSEALLRAGPAFDLLAFLHAHPDLSVEEAADKVRYALLRRIERERTIVLGPSTKSPQRIRDEILRSPRVRPHLEAAARTSGKPLDVVREQAATDLDALIAAPSFTLLGWLNRGLDRVWNQLYDGLVVDDEGMARIREASRKGTVILLPSHKSHIDYVVLSDVFYARGLSPPLVAAGDNLNFWPLGPTLRRAGAFFIHRALAGQKLYSALLSAYIRRLLLEGFTLEVFIEGGRSRTGKLLPPKLGLLSMIVDAALALHGRPVYFVPVAIVYERVIEEAAFMRELAGFEKQTEDVVGLLRAPGALRSRYGRLYLQIGEILSMDALRGEAQRSSRGGAEDGNLSPKARRTLIQDIAHRTMHEINRVTLVTPAALVATTLLCHRRRGITKPEVVELAHELRAALKLRGAPIAPTLADPSPRLLAAAVTEALDLFVAGGLLQSKRSGAEIVMRVPSSQRIALEYYKNTIIHFIAPTALVAAVMLSAHGAALARTELVTDIEALAARFSLELVLTIPSDRLWNEVIGEMLTAGELVETPAGVAIAPGPRGAMLERYAWLVRGSLEGYRIALRGLTQLRAEPMALQPWLKQTIRLADRMYLAGEIEMREAVSRDRLINALHALHSLSVVRLQTDVSVGAGKSFTPERLTSEEALIRRYLS